MSAPNVAIIPARGGSKRIPRKNIRPFCGIPMIAHSIERAKASGAFDRIIVSTDDDEIASVAESWGAEAPFRRPADLSNDTAGTIPVIQHTIEWLAANGSAPNLVCCIYATAPFLDQGDLVKGRALLENPVFDFAFSVAAFSAPVQRGFTIAPSGGVQMMQPESFSKRSQDLETAYHDAGQFYWGRTEAWRHVANMFTPKSAAVVLPKYRVQDIDDAEDWQRAEFMFEAIKRMGEG
jgi:pseudaminic acid cytidylyltransferase